MFIRKGRFPSAWRLLLGQSHRDHGGPLDAQMSSRPPCFTPARRRPAPLCRGPAPALLPPACSSLGPRTCSPWQASHSRGWRACEAHICCPGHGDLCSHRQGLRCQPHVESWIVVVCLCLLKLGLEQGPRRRDSLECAQGLCSQLCQQAQEMAAGLGQHRLPQNPPSGGDQGTDTAARTEVPFVWAPPSYPPRVCSMRP